MDWTKAMMVTYQKSCSLTRVENPPSMQDYGRPDSRQHPKAIHGLVSEGGAENGDVEALFRQEDVVFLITIVSR